MFNNRTDGPLCVAVTLADGRELKGKFVVPAGRSLSDALNGGTSFIEFEPFGEQRTFIAKSVLQSVKQITISPNPSLAPLREENFDPFAVLGVTAETNDEAVHRAYINLAKTYHPDRYATTGLPSEVCAYLSAMARRINAAYEAVERTRQPKPKRQEPTFTAGRL